jgi:hypothetical protein
MSKFETINSIELRFACNALIILCAMVLFFLILSWALGGRDFYNSLMGNYAMPILLAGIAAGIAPRFGYRRQQAGDGELATAIVTSRNRNGRTQGLA